MPQPPIAPETIAWMREQREAGQSVEAIATAAKVSPSVVSKYTKDVRIKARVTQASVTQPPIPITMPEPASEAGGPQFPDPIDLSFAPFVVDAPGHAGILSDAHIPYHDKPTIMAWVAECKRRDVKTLILNGDILDCGEVSSHYRTPSDTRLEEELDSGERFFQWLRATFPRARIIYKSGNHEDRLPRYISNNAPALFTIKALTLPALLKLDSYGVEWVQDKRPIMLGKLPIVHGHEFRGGGGVNPARWLFLRAVSTAMCGHFHRTSEHHEQALDRKLHGVWSVGCACFLYPAYDPNNKWNHGFAMAEVAQDGKFTVTNKRLLRDGTIC